MLTLLKLLQDGHFHSGQAIGQALRISRSAVWKQVRRLESEFGVELNRVRGRGYQLVRPIVLLGDTALAKKGLSDIYPFYIYESLGSTNAEAIRLLEKGVEPPFLILAEKQTAGRGRRGRIWQSPFGENIYLSLAVRIQKGARQLEGLSLVVGLAVMQALRASGVSGVGLKWPNDVLVQGKKIAGVLLELTGDPADVCHVVVGVGVNVNMEDGGYIEQPWTSMRLELQSYIDRNFLVYELCLKLREYLVRHAESGFVALQKEWELNHLWQGCEVALIAGAQRIEGVVLGVDHVGALRLSVNGVEQRHSGGEISLRLRDDHRA
ncbi:BirA family transcriptional regulator, biotin operon repressor / biotin-[acetyl-CoA-carboxylase] ligase [Azotobacter beijerinckii]|uniref:Bifunctional ligase/repressor BirA n=1 Tax=Azotobacter beijerinckii TaxID=170623 RepID=A0A1H7ANR0_9GAMM|nr:bifunctional biotin--[acetyl-CoA-carboxylase] ligase/biotin operon repressor BirA [Azotobacter beijerinckii]SEJ54435.1 BirA family transcriptional regulator, biotin operon repressor / biotin-[acetyl-CoA-carboxylase] ligase [Azotobacter beijerinckii]SEJ67291.1 BirA family transcriptional regulator, biotin operon repressor / biotin-[acetyl-CoA-carboxylase] ligase [Azotobacter beijerinckii]